MNIEIGTKLVSECVACSEDEVWEVESISTEEYSDGLFRTYNLKAIKNCISDTVTTSIKDCPEVLDFFRVLNKNGDKIK